MINRELVEKLLKLDPELKVVHDWKDESYGGVVRSEEITRVSVICDEIILNEEKE